MSMLLQQPAGLVQLPYRYCCEFVVNLDSLTRSSYYEANTWVLLVFIPGLPARLIGVRVRQ